MDVSFIKLSVVAKQPVFETLVESRPYEDFLRSIDGICIDGVDYKLLCNKYDVTNNKLIFYFTEISHVTQTND